jgi:hypothetical protein
MATMRKTLRITIYNILYKLTLTPVIFRLTLCIYTPIYGKSYETWGPNTSKRH